MLVYIFFVSSNMGQEDPIIFTSLKEARKALKTRYKEDKSDYKGEIMDSELYDDSAYIELFENYIYYGIYDVKIN